MKEIPILYKRRVLRMHSLLCYLFKKAILMVEDEEEFEYPQIDENKCVRYFQVFKVCQVKMEWSLLA